MRLAECETLRFERGPCLPGSLASPDSCAGPRQEVWHAGFRTIYRGRQTRGTAIRPRTDTTSRRALTRLPRHHQRTLHPPTTHAAFQPTSPTSHPQGLCTTYPERPVGCRFLRTPEVSGTSDDYSNSSGFEYTL